MNQNSSKWIMIYEDHLTKFCVLQSLTLPKATEVDLLQAGIFLLMGAPVILQSDYGFKFTATVITELAIILPNLKIVHVKQSHP